MVSLTWFGGFGRDGTAQWMASAGLNPGFLMALFSATSALLIMGGGNFSTDRYLIDTKLLPSYEHD